MDRAILRDRITESDTEGDRITERAIEKQKRQTQ